MEGGKDIKDRAYCLTHENGTQDPCDKHWVDATHTCTIQCRSIDPHRTAEHLEELSTDAPSQTGDAQEDP